MSYFHRSRNAGDRFTDILAAVERCRRYQKLRSPDTPWPSIAGLRNIAVHEYFRVDHDLIARTVQEELLPLVDAIRQIGVQQSSE